jgi:hypothetical protein
LLGRDERTLCRLRASRDAASNPLQTRETPGAAVPPCGSGVVAWSLVRALAGDDQEQLRAVALPASRQLTEVAVKGRGALGLIG